MRILVINVLYPPQAFGGATIVADQTTRLFVEAGDEVLVITSDQSGHEIPGSLYRYEWGDVPVVAVAVSPGESSAYRNESFAARFVEICDAFRPDVVLTHCVQGMGASFLEYCEAARIPSVVFVHDAWWLCERQFMINGHGSYCHQSSITPAVCRFCVDDPPATARRDRYLRERLLGADSVLFPSQFFRDLYVSSGIPADRCCVVKNGVQAARPSHPSPCSQSPARVRFGFVGGVGPIKGADNIRRVFMGLERTDYELVCVDNLTNLGLTSHQFADWRIRGALRVRLGYTQSSIDDFFDEIDVLLFPSQWKESFGLAVREALIRHKWVIATDGGGTTEDIVPGVNGAIIPLGYDIGPLHASVVKCFDRDWRNYRNPHADRIVTFERQAAVLRAHLEQIWGARHCDVSGMQ